MIKGLMKCWHCGHELVWGCDFSFDDYCMDGDGIVSTFSCSNCPAEATLTLPFDEEDESDVIPSVEGDDNNATRNK